MALIVTQYYQSPVGTLVLGTLNDKLCLCNWHDKKNKIAVERRLLKHFKAELTPGDNALLKSTAGQLDDYFLGIRTRFELPIITAGTEFQQQVWRRLLTINYGQTMSYSGLAHAIAKPSAIRAVANANAANALSIIIPCHRIIGQDGSLVGYAGGVSTKQRLLSLEQSAPHLSPNPA